MSTNPLPLASLKLDQLSMNLISLGTERPLEEMLEACIRHGIRTVAPWQLHYGESGARGAINAIRARGLNVTTLCRMSLFGPADSKMMWQQALDEGKRVLDEAAAMGAKTVTFIGGGLPVSGKSILDVRSRIRDGLSEILPYARSAGVVLALEPLHPMCVADRGAIGTLQVALDWAHELGEGTGVLVDTYNQWWDPALEQVIKKSEGRIVGFQVSDWLVPTQDLAFDRGMMGDGIIDIPLIRSWVESTGYQDPIEVEILSHRWSKLSLDELIPLIILRFQSAC
ncbi:sugar phosphate isomerase/epimerase family protein [Pseudomonas fluorescens]|uniref:Xylose isomerase-like TIM barrel domain-containing protein n=1 Tax=Pseudomonas fluorescens TaxID=294 RepID=A0A5E7GS10_PSEFL|nr:sugar phosphate isomerase/epimerase family protein [Pseudomonas fluorescens]VVO53467.1 hypothetical protein PS880_00420 [Pseudomonas fluorescens]